MGRNHKHIRRPFMLSSRVCICIILGNHLEWYIYLYIIYIVYEPCEWVPETEDDFAFGVEVVQLCRYSDSRLCAELVAGQKGPHGEVREITDTAFTCTRKT